VNTSTEQVARSGTYVAARRVLRDTSSLLLLTQIVFAGAAFVANILAARTMGPSGRGELALLLQLAYFGSLGVLLGTDRSVVAVYTGRPAAVVVRAFLRLLARPSAVALAVSAVVLLLPLPGLTSWRTRLALAALFVVANSFDRAIRSIAIASGRGADYFWYGLAEELLLVAGLCGLMAFGVAASGWWMLVYLGAGVVAGTCWLWRWSRIGEPGTARPPADAVPEPGAAPVSDTDRLRRARREGLQLLPATVSNSGTLRLDRLILVVLASTAALGLYAAVATVTELIAWPLLVFADSRLGLWRQAYDAGSLSLRRALLVGAGYSVLAAGALVAVLHVVLVPILGPEYAPALPLITPLAVAAGVFGISRLLVGALIAVHRSTLSSVVEVTGLVVSLIAYLTLIGPFHALGAAYGSLIGYSACLVLAAVLLLRYRRRPAPDAVPGVVGKPR
jgi:O-antigen/teichoic acid export membrane protein